MKKRIKVRVKKKIIQKGPQLRCTILPEPYFYDIFNSFNNITSEIQGLYYGFSELSHEKNLRIHKIWVWHLKKFIYIQNELFGIGLYILPLEVDEEYESFFNLYKYSLKDLMELGEKDVPILLGE